MSDILRAVVALPLPVLAVAAIGVVAAYYLIGFTVADLLAEWERSIEWRDYE